MDNYKDSFMENRDGDWLAQEKQREDRVKNMGIEGDDYSLFKRRHGDSSEAHYVKKEHAREHRQYAEETGISYNPPKPERPYSSNRSNLSGRKSSGGNKGGGSAVAAVLIIVVFAVSVIVTIFSELSGSYYYADRFFDVIFPIAFMLIWLTVFIVIISTVIRSLRK